MVEINSTVTDVMDVEVEICLWVPTDGAENSPDKKRFLITNRFEKKQNWGDIGKNFDPAVTVAEFFNESSRDMNYTWF